MTTMGGEDSGEPIAMETTMTTTTPTTTTTTTTTTLGGGEDTVKPLVQVRMISFSHEHLREDANHGPSFTTITLLSLASPGGC